MRTIVVKFPEFLKKIQWKDKQKPAFSKKAEDMSRSCSTYKFSSAVSFEKVVEKTPRKLLFERSLHSNLPSNIEIRRIHNKLDY